MFYNFFLSFLKGFHETFLWRVKKVGPTFRVLDFLDSYIMELFINTGLQARCFFLFKNEMCSSEFWIHLYFLLFGRECDTLAVCLRTHLVEPKLKVSLTDTTERLRGFVREIPLHHKCYMFHIGSGYMDSTTQSSSLNRFLALQNLIFALTVLLS